MTDFKLTQDGDLDVSGSDIQFVEKIHMVRQNLSIRLKFFLGEWFLNITIGVPYFQSILVKNPNEVAIISFFKKTILQTNNINKFIQTPVLEIISKEDREFKITFSVDTDYGLLDFEEVI